MLLRPLLALLLLLLYFWYMAGSGDARVAPPTTPMDATEPDNSYRFHQSYRGYQFGFDKSTWHTDLPDDYLLGIRQIRRKDPCHAVRNHGKALATGSLLYEYLRSERFQTSASPTTPHPIAFDASTAFQVQSVYYFECMNQEIAHLRQCPPGHVFRHHDCVPVSVCLDQPDGTKFPNPLDTLSYYHCFRSQPRKVQCEPDTFFDHDHCKKTDIPYVCRHNTFQVLDPKLLLVCRGGRATFETCPSGYRYFDNPTQKPVCEMDACVGVADGQKRSLPTKTKNGLKYSPGFVTCHGDRVQDIVNCPPNWDTFGSDHQLPLSQVFDSTLQTCTAPQFCENVQPEDADTIVPVHEWTKHLSRWKYASLMDQVTGYKCVSGTRTRTLVPAGFRIGRNMRMESACREDATALVVVSDQPNAYYDCATGTVQTCGNDAYFDGKACRPYTEHAFQYKGIDVFTMDSLNWDAWIKPWTYTSSTTVIDAKNLKKNCSSPHVYDHVYNACIHSDCRLYPFLTQMEFSIGLPDGSTCEFNATTRYLDKIEAVHQEKYLYWSQRTTLDALSVLNEPCVEGQPIQSGQFAFDRTLFATCENQQPFVFCPSPLTNGIEKRDGVFFCKPDPLLATVTMPPRQLHKFVVNEVRHITSATSTRIKINNASFTLPAGQPLDLMRSRTRQREITVETTDAPVTLHYNSRVTHPPNVALMYNHGSLDEVKVNRNGELYVLEWDLFGDSATMGVFSNYTPRNLLPS